MAIDLEDSYREYLARFDREVGPAQIGEFAKFRGRLIKKLAHGEFAPALAEYHELAERYHTSLERGDTINDVMVKLLREQAAKLVLEPPA